MNLKTLKGIAKKVYHWLRHPGDSISQRVVHGGVWVFALRVVNRGFSLIRTVVLARLLAPDDFGLFGVAMIAMASIKAFTKTGFDQSLIQKKEDTEPYLDSAWTIQIIRGAVLSLLLLAGAPLIGIFFGEPRAIMLVRVLGVAVFVKSLRNIGVVYFRKEINFHKQFVYQFAGTISDLAVALLLAFIFRSVWALIGGLLARNTTKLFLSYIVHDYRPSLDLNWEKGRELFEFGRWILGSAAIGFLLHQGDDILVGKILSTTALGFYQLAYRISNLPSRQISNVISKVTFPAYSKLQEDTQRLKSSYLVTLQATMIVTAPIAAAIAFFARDFTSLFLGAKWLPMVPSMQVLAVYGFMWAIGSTFGSIFRAIGRPDISTKLKFANLIILAILIYPLTKTYGILGTSIAVAINSVLVSPVPFYVILKTLEIDKYVFFKTILTPLFNSGITVFVVYLTRTLVLSETTMLNFFFEAFVGFGVYVSLSWITDRFLPYGVKGKILPILQNSLTSGR